MDLEQLIDKQYRIAIEARDKLNDNYHKWMSFYYIANGAILVAMTSIYGKNNTDNVTLLAFSIIGIFTCGTWNLSCRGYYYWSLSWIDIIHHLEKLSAKSKVEIMPYALFSKTVVDKFDHKNGLTIPANISTPKLTLRFSIFAISCWSLYFDYLLNRYLDCLSNVIQTGIFIGVLILIYCLLLLYPRLVISRIGDSHNILDFKKCDEEVISN